ncbi:MAG: cell wall synthesis protein, partial [Corynebacterium variabile]
TRLKTFLESQLEELNSRSTAAPSANNINFGNKK